MLQNLLGRSCSLSRCFEIMLFLVMADVQIGQPSVTQIVEISDTVFACLGYWSQ